MRERAARADTRLTQRRSGDVLPTPPKGDAGTMSQDRITPFDETCTVEERIDEIVATGVDVQIEMLGEDCAFMSVGTDTFAIYVDRGKLFIAWRENDSAASR